MKKHVFFIVLILCLFLVACNQQSDLQLATGANAAQNQAILDRLEQLGITYETIEKTDRLIDNYSYYVLTDADSNVYHMVLRNSDMQVAAIWTELGDYLYIMDEIKTLATMGTLTGDFAQLQLPEDTYTTITGGGLGTLLGSWLLPYFDAGQGIHTFLYRFTEDGDSFLITGHGRYQTDEGPFWRGEYQVDENGVFSAILSETRTDPNFVDTTQNTITFTVQRPENLDGFMVFTLLSIQGDSEEFQATFTPILDLPLPYFDDLLLNIRSELLYEAAGEK